MTDNRGRGNNPNAAENLDDEARKRGGQSSGDQQQDNAGITSDADEGM
jgi:hypothetical protein